MLEEAEAYPKEEMYNELAGIFGLYFGFSVISLASLFHHTLKKVKTFFKRKFNAGTSNGIRYTVFENFLNIKFHVKI